MNGGSNLRVKREVCNRTYAVILSGFFYYKLEIL